ncbi:Histidine-rich glycoprotein [Aix galericulata]|nr:Histidine-rich glycoprotein [Aix galericulata]
MNNVVLFPKMKQSSPLLLLLPMMNNTVLPMVFLPIMDPTVLLLMDHITHILLTTVDHMVLPITMGHITHILLTTTDHKVLLLPLLMDHITHILLTTVGHTVLPIIMGHITHILTIMDHTDTILIPIITTDTTATRQAHQARAIYRIPVLSTQDSLTAPSAKFPELSHLGPQSPSADEGTSFTDPTLEKMPKSIDFPDHRSQSESCPGKPKLDLPQILPLFPYSSTAQTSSP